MHMQTTSKSYYNIKIIWIAPFFILLFFAENLQAQVKAIASVKEYCNIVKKDDFQQMIGLKETIPSIVYDLKYATKENFTHQRLYKKGNKTFVRLAVANALKNVQYELNKKGYGLKIWDAYRPYAVTKKMWELIHDDRYVADPSKGSGHNRGLAVDLTIIELSTGKELNMGTGFDNFTDTAHQTFKDLPAAIMKSRQLLRSTMEKNGFKALETEWWHFSWPNDRNYEVLDIEFKKLEKSCH